MKSMSDSLVHLDGLASALPHGLSAQMVPMDLICPICAGYVAIFKAELDADADSMCAGHETET